MAYRYRLHVYPRCQPEGIRSSGSNPNRLSAFTPSLSKYTPKNRKKVGFRDSRILGFGSSIDTMMNGWTPPDLDFETEGEAYHCPKPFPVEAAYESAVEAKMGQFCARNQFYLDSA